EPAPWTISRGWRTEASSAARRRIAARRGVRRRAFSVRTLPPSFTRSMEIRATHGVTLNAFPVRPPIREGLNSARPFERPSDDDAQTRKHVSRDSRTGLRSEAVHGWSPRDPDQPVRHRGSADEIPGPHPPDRRGAVPNPPHRPRGRPHLREPLHREEGGKRVPPQAPCVSAQRTPREQDRDGGWRGPHLGRNARRLRRRRGNRRTRAPWREDLHDLDDRGACRRREGSAPQGRREAADTVADADRAGRAEEALEVGDTFFSTRVSAFQIHGRNGSAPRRDPWPELEDGRPAVPGRSTYQSGGARPGDRSKGRRYVPRLRGSLVRSVRCRRDAGGPGRPPGPRADASPPIPSRLLL